MVNTAVDEVIESMREWLLKNDRRKYELARRLDTTEANVSRWLSGKHKISKAWRELIRQRLA